MTLNHLNLTVVSPDETSAFLAKYFDLEPRGGNAGIQMLSDDKGMVLTLIKARAEDRDQGPGVRDQGDRGWQVVAGPGGSSAAAAYSRTATPPKRRGRFSLSEVCSRV